MSRSVRLIIKNSKSKLFSLGFCQIILMTIRRQGRSIRQDKHIGKFTLASTDCHHKPFVGIDGVSVNACQQHTYTMPPTHDVYN
jgi:hypothetical protein